MKIFFVEGPDGSGKTTVINKFINLDRMSKFRIKNYDPDKKIYCHAVLGLSQFSSHTRNVLMDMADQKDIHNQEALLDLSLVSLTNVLREAEIKFKDSYHGLVLDRGLLSAFVYRSGISFDYFIDRLKVFRIDSSRTLFDLCQDAYHLMCKPDQLVQKSLNSYDLLDQSVIKSKFNEFIESDLFNTFIIPNEPILNKSEGDGDFPDPVGLGSIIYSAL